MAVATIAHKPELTVEQAKALFARQFEGKYTVQDWKGPNIGARRDFLVVKNAFAAVAVKLEQNPDSTKFVYSGIGTTVLGRMATSGLLGIFSYFLWNGPTNDVRQFIETAPEFQPASMPAFAGAAGVAP